MWSAAVVRVGVLVAVCAMLAGLPAVAPADVTRADATIAGSGPDRPTVAPGTAAGTGAGAAPDRGAALHRGVDAGAGVASGGAAGAPPDGGARTGPSAPRPSRPAVVHREITAPGGSSADVLDVDLTAPGVRVGLLTAGDVSDRASVAAMADRAGARAAVNGDFFDLGRSNAPAGPQVRDGRTISSAVPAGRRLAPAVDGATPDSVLAFGADGRARVDRVRFGASVQVGASTIPVEGINQYAVPPGGVGLVTPEWGGADRARMLCGSDTDRNAGCSADRIEVSVRDGAVAAVRPPGAGRLAPGETALLGRDGGADALRAVRPGDPVTVLPHRALAEGSPPVTAVGGSPIVVDGARPGPLDDRERAPRTAAGIADGGRRLLLVTVDGHETAHSGATLAGLAGMLTSLGARDAVNLDGGGSSTMVARPPDARRVSVVNAPAQDATRLVPNALGVFTPQPRRGPARRLATRRP
ncbi:phosphodiester glycosidase family protein [Pseudonocardia endophytica]|uniref:Uncharacterized protein DUF2233 n=1 Tax=Pseudonocardia endophytica TaxID=401976 RepID=A0A4R1HWL3_PSEEN|nr:phosphodiester glycosidase family protein [Pseudonocardia endophytica]TCK25150.1 uncharacterized protein DUF2233 [Pseudonocardia endophytica]